MRRARGSRPPTPRSSSIWRQTGCGSSPAVGCSTACASLSAHPLRNVPASCAASSSVRGHPRSARAAGHAEAGRALSRLLLRPHLPRLRETVQRDGPMPGVPEPSRHGAGDTAQPRRPGRQAHSRDLPAGIGDAATVAPRRVARHRRDRHRRRSGAVLHDLTAACRGCPRADRQSWVPLLHFQEAGQGTVSGLLDGVHPDVLHRRRGLPAGAQATGRTRSERALAAPASVSSLPCARSPACRCAASRSTASNISTSPAARWSPRTTRPWGWTSPGTPR